MESNCSENVFRERDESGSHKKDESSITTKVKTAVLRKARAADVKKLIVTMMVIFLFGWAYLSLLFRGDLD